jgi:hypothetical protein
MQKFYSSGLDLFKKQKIIFERIVIYEQNLDLLLMSNLNLKKVYIHTK